MDTSLSKFWEVVEHRGTWHASVHGVTKSQTWLRRCVWVPHWWGMDHNGFFNVSPWLDYVCVCSILSRFSHVQLGATLWTAAWWAPLPIGLSRKEYWSGTTKEMTYYRELAHVMMGASQASPKIRIGHQEGRVWVGCNLQACAEAAVLRCCIFSLLGRTQLCF